jgi:hypothetical protein
MKDLTPYINEASSVDWYAHYSDSDAVYRAAERHKEILAAKLKAELTELQIFEVLSKTMKSGSSIRVGNVFYMKDNAGNFMFKLIQSEEK